MQVKVTIAFNDQTIEEEADRRREIGDSFDATPERAGYLETLGYVEKIDQNIPVEDSKFDAISAEPVAPAAAVPGNGVLATSTPPATADFHVAQN